MNQLLNLLAGSTKPVCLLVNLYRDALTQLVDDLIDAGEDRHPETGEEYSSVRYARLVLNIAPRTESITCKQDTALLARVNALEDALLAAIPFVRYCYNQAPAGEDARELEALNLCRMAIALEPVANLYTEEEQL